MIEIVFRNGEIETWERSQYTDYKYDGKCFIIIKDNQWIGIYNMKTVTKVVID